MRFWIRLKSSLKRTQSVLFLVYTDFNIAKETKDKLDMIDLFYANKNLYEKLVYQKQGKGVK